MATPYKVTRFDRVKYEAKRTAGARVTFCRCVSEVIWGACTRMLGCVGGSQRENKHVIYSVTRAEVDIRTWKQQQKSSQGSSSGESWTHSVQAVKNWWFLKTLSWETLTGLEKRLTSVIMGQQQTDIAPVREVRAQTAEVQEGRARRNLLQN